MRLQRLFITLGFVIGLPLLNVVATETATVVTTPTVGTHGSLVTGNLPKAAGANQITDSGLPSTAQGNGSKVQLSTGTTTNLDCARYDGSGNVVDAGAPCGTGSGGGNVSTTGSPTTGNLAVFSAPSTITNGDLSGDCTTAATLAIICTKTNGVAFAAIATSANASDLSVGTLPNARLSAIPNSALATPAPCSAFGFTSSTCPQGNLVGQLAGTNSWTALNTFLRFQFTGLTATGTTQDINDQKGTSGDFANSPWNGQSWELSSGTNGAPNVTDGPLFKVSKIEAMPDGTSCGGNNVANSCNALVELFSEGLATDHMQVNTLWVGAKSASAACDAGATNACNALAFRSESRLVGNSPFKASAGEFISRVDSTNVLSGLKGIEIDLRNNYASNTPGNCDTTSYTGTGNCNGAIMLRSQGSNALTGPAIHIVADSGSSLFNEGIVINALSVKNYGLIDKSNATTSIDIEGTHTTAINIANGAGPLVFGTNAITTVGSITSNTAAIGNLASFCLSASRASSTIPTLLPNCIDLTTGIGATALHIGTLIAFSTDIAEFSTSGFSLVTGVYSANGSSGVSCTGITAPTFRSVNGIVTHC